MANKSVKQHIENILTNYEIKIRNKTICQDLKQERRLQIIGICFSLVLVLMIASNFIMNTVVTVLYGYAILNVIMIILNLYQGKIHKDTVKRGNIRCAFAYLGGECGKRAADYKRNG